MNTAFPYPAKKHPTDEGTHILTHHFATDRKAKLARFEIVKEVGPETHVRVPLQPEAKDEP